MSPAMAPDSGFSGRAARIARRVIGGVVAVGFVVLVVAAGAVVAVAAMAIAAILALGVALTWLVAKVAGRDRGRAQTAREERRDTRAQVLTARRGPHGWSVDVTEG